MTAAQNHLPSNGRMLGRASIGALIACIASACVSAGAGYDDVQALTSQRLGTELRRGASGSAYTASGAAGADSKQSVEVSALLEGPLTAERAAKVALLNSPALTAELERVGVARAELASALRLPNPHVGGALLYGHGDSPEVEVDAMISLSALLFLPSRQGAASAALNAAAHEVTASAIDLAYDARREFYAYQAALARLELVETVLVAFGAAADMAERLFEAGNITQLRLASEQALYEEARIEHARAEAAVAAARETVNARLGLWGNAGTSWTAEARLPEAQAVGPLLANLEHYAVEQSLSIQVAQLRYQAAAKSANLARFTGWVPELSAGVAAERSEDGWAYGPAAELSIPLFYQGQGESAAALSQMRQQQARAQQAALQVRARARQVAVDLETTHKMLEHYRDVILPLREQVLEQAQLQYNAMSLGVFDLLRAKRDQVSAGETYVELMYEYWKLRSDLEQLRAGGLPQQSSTSVAAAPTGATSAADAH